MLSLFPTLFDFNIIAVTTLRVIVALLFLWEGRRVFQDRRHLVTTSFAVLSLCAGALLLVGLFTQADSIVLSLTALFLGYRENKGKSVKDWDIRYFVLLFVVTLSFLFFGPGMLSIDYPL